MLGFMKIKHKSIQKKKIMNGLDSLVLSIINEFGPSITLFQTLSCFNFMDSPNP